MDGVLVRRVGTVSSLCAAGPGDGRQTPDLHAGRVTAALAPRWQRTLLHIRGLEIDGCSREGRSWNVRSRCSTVTVRTRSHYQWPRNRLPAFGGRPEISDYHPGRGPSRRPAACDYLDELDGRIEQVEHPRNEIHGSWRSVSASFFRRLPMPPSPRHSGNKISG